MVDMLGGRLLVTRGGAWVEAEAVLQNKVVALYFASTRCAPSRDFTPLLCDFYSELVEQACPPAPLAVVFVSADCSAQDMEDFLLQLPDAWLALPFHDPYRQITALRLTKEGNQIVADIDMRSLCAGQGHRKGVFISCPILRKVTPVMGRFAKLSELRTRYHITATPKLVILKPSGEVITYKGRKQIQERGQACFQDWVEAAEVFQNFSG